ncbi:MAG: SET family sugar efflux transporter-like MFS transporter [Psychromonas sp.]|jgi:SET family sugar efflux transporter-like MFS transporter|uniref:sugar efflux transporter n=1 Tax=Psychromonas sp. TaxID=1884585 RepID=UPI0039E6CD06
MFFSKQSITYLLTCFFIGLSTAFIYPILSLYLIEEVHATPISMGILITCMVLSGVLVSQYIAKKSDKGLSRKYIVLAGQVGFITTTIFLAMSHHYYTILFAVIFFMSLSAVCLPQIFSMGRDYADKQLADKAPAFVTMMRATMAMAWVVGPPVAFLINDSFGFKQTFLLAGFFAVVVFIIVCLGMSNVRLEKVASASQDVNWLKISGVLFFLICIFFVFTANNMYLTSISLYITQELNFESKWVGYLMGTAAFVEIPIMLGAGYLAPRFGATRLIYIACISGFLFFTGLLVAQQLWQFMLLQLFNGVFIGINASLGMLVVQDMMKKQIGLASTLFNNSIMLSVLLSSLIVGGIAQYFSYYAVFIASALFCILALFFIWLAEKECLSLKAEFNQPACID